MSHRTHSRTVESPSTTAAVTDPLCDDCGSLCFPDAVNWRCDTCGSTTRKRDTAAFVTTRSREARSLTIRGSSADRGLPTTTTTCPECANDTAYWDIKQLRASDEAPTELYICTTCAHTWRRD